MTGPHHLQDMATAMRDECLAMRARQLNRRITRIYDAALRPHGVSTAQLNVLVALAVAGEARATDIGAALGIEKSTLSRNLERLMKERWVEVVPGSRLEGRALRLSAAGAGLVEEALPAWREAQRRAAAELPADLRAALLRTGGPVGRKE